MKVICTMKSNLIWRDVKMLKKWKLKVVNCQQVPVVNNKRTNYKWFKRLVPLEDKQWQTSLQVLKIKLKESVLEPLNQLRLNSQLKSSSSRRIPRPSLLTVSQITQFSTDSLNTKEISLTISKWFKLVSKIQDATC